ncbi:MAG: LysM peptidoglycan-binding domain-containing protein [Fidelibacterota bacterium]|nr:MAG: LysM peptidoglycan-binding domain-containing protein [Candidatus Neomarinimicrobiota bacterium]
MKTKKGLLISSTVCGVLIWGACAKPAAEEVPSPVEEEVAPPVEEVVEMPLVEEDTIPEVPEPVVEEVVMPEEPVIIPQEEYADIEQEPDGTPHPDSAAYWYMIRPNDYLTKIAYIEYGNPNEWRRIYSWNRERIGDNPNLIYPYYSLQLYKPEAEVKEWDYDYLIHTVETGETLWSIAGEEYGDGIAWIVIFWDNEELLNSNAGRIKPGMELRIRTTLWPDY